MDKVLDKSKSIIIHLLKLFYHFLQSRTEDEQVIILISIGVILTFLILYIASKFMD